MSSNQKQIDDFMYRTFGYRPLRKAPTESGLSPEQHAALTARFPRATPPPPPETPQITEETHSGMSAQQRARLDPARRDMMAAALHRYREARPRQTSDEEGTPMRSVGVAMPTGVVLPFLRVKTRLYGDAWGVDAARRRQLQNEKAKQYHKRLAAEHLKQGSLTDGSVFLNLAGLARHQADLIAKEYIKWRKSGGGPFPDLSKYENPVPRRKDGTLWDYREAFKRMADLDDRAKQYDSKHGLNLSPNIFDPHYAWYHIHLGIDPSEHGTGAGSLKELERSGLSPHQHMEGVKDLMNLGLHHQRLSRLHAEGADDE